MLDYNDAAYTGCGGSEERRSDELGAALTPDQQKFQNTLAWLSCHQTVEVETFDAADREDLKHIDYVD
jgi:hypothetical protein